MLSSSLRRWAEFFDHPSQATLARLSEEDPIMADTIKKLETVSADDENYYIAEAHWKGEVRLKTELAYEREEGRAEGLTESVVTVLQARFGSVPPDVREAIEAADLPTRRTMLARAVTAASFAEFLEG